MDELLRPVTTKITVVEETKFASDEALQLPDVIKNPEDALHILKESPTWAQVQKVLEYLTDSENGDYNIKQPGALAAQLIQALVTQTLPNFWSELKREKAPARTKSKFLDTLLSVSGIGALFSRIKILTAACKLNPNPGETAISPLQLEAVLETIEELLKSGTVFGSIWTDCVLHSETVPRRTVLWKEFVSLVASGKLMSSFAEAEDVLKTSNSRYKTMWISKGTEYTRWLAQNVSHMIKASSTMSAEIFSAAKMMCSKALALGYSGMLSILNHISPMADFGRCLC
jgi:telomere length regulation protein